MITEQNHREIERQLQTLVQEVPGIPLQVAAWHVRGPFGNDFYNAYRGVQAGIRHGVYKGIEIRPHDVGQLSCLWAGPGSTEQVHKLPGRPKAELTPAAAKKHWNRLVKSGKKPSIRKIAKELGVSEGTLRNRLK